LSDYAGSKNRVFPGIPGFAGSKIRLFPGIRAYAGSNFWAVLNYNTLIINMLSLKTPHLPLSNPIFRLKNFQ
jgi:hypothetical protein